MELPRDELIAALRDMTDVDRATIYAESIPKPAPITLDDLKTMTPEQIVDAHKAGRLDHIAEEKAARKQQLRAERGAAYTAQIRDAEQRKAQQRADRSIVQPPASGDHR